MKKNSIHAIIKKLRAHGKKIVFTNGCFDIIHSGHVKLLRECAQLGDFVIVGINSDSSVRKLKGKSRPLNKLKDRIEVLKAIRYVDYVIPFSEITPYNLIKSIKPDFLVKGGDYKENEVVGKEFAGRVVIVDLLKGISTTKIIEKVLNK